MENNSYLSNYCCYGWWTNFKEKSGKITNSFPFRILAITLFSIGLYHYLHGYKNRYYGIDELKYILILDKNAKLSKMECRRSAKYFFDIKTQSITQSSIIDLFSINGWKKYERYGIIKLVKNNVKMSMSVGEEYKTSTSVILIWQ
jgi:hypothetical protein